VLPIHTHLPYTTYHSFMPDSFFYPNQLHGAEHYSRDPQLFGHSLVSQQFMVPEGSIPNSQELSTCPYPEPDQSSPHPPSHLYKIHPNIILHLRLGLPSALLPSGFPTNNLYAFLFSPIRATCPTHLILLALFILTILDEEYKS
jgi:hypothetical protein